LGLIYLRLGSPAIRHGSRALAPPLLENGVGVASVSGASHRWKISVGDWLRGEFRIASPSPNLFFYSVM